MDWLRTATTTAQKYARITISLYNYFSVLIYNFLLIRNNFELKMAFENLRVNKKKIMQLSQYRT